MHATVKAADEMYIRIEGKRYVCFGLWKMVMDVCTEKCLKW